MIKYLDLQKINASFEPELSEALLRVSHSGWYLHGEATARFEEEFAAYCGTSYCVGTGNGLDALTLIFLTYRELGVMNAGDEVIVPANTYIATLLSILRAGLKPMLCEPSFETCNIDAAYAETLITSRTRAILPVHLYGRLADMKEICKLANRYGLKVIEDAAQAHGAVWNKGLPGKGNHPLRAGNLGDAAAFSFYPAKNLGALGDGGAITTHDARLAATVRSIANYGSTEKYVHRYQGINSRLDELQAAVLNVKLGRLDEDNEHRRRVACRYMKEIKNPEVVLPQMTTEADAHVFHIFTIFTPGCDRLREHLEHYGVQSLIHYPIPPHRQGALSAYASLSLPVTERIHREELSLPMSPLLTDEEVNSVVTAVNTFNG
mgnify:CR=1 FL=1